MPGSCSLCLLRRPNNDLNVRQTEEYIRSLTGEKRPDNTKQKTKLDPDMQEIENHLRQLVGTKVSLRPGKNGAGSISIHYYSAEDLEAIIDKLSRN